MIPAWIDGTLTPVEKLDAHRLTLTAHCINAAREVIFIVTGEGKAPALREVLVGDRDEQRYPSQLVAPTDGQLTFLVDRAAAAELPRTHEHITRIDHGADA